MTYTMTGTEATFADPYKRCSECKQWITGVVEMAGEPLLLMPCEHQAPYFDVCPSWGPVDGCKCPGGERGHAPPEPETPPQGGTTK